MEIGILLPTIQVTGNTLFRIWTRNHFESQLPDSPSFSGDIFKGKKSSFAKTSNESQKYEFTHLKLSYFFFVLNNIILNDDTLQVVFAGLGSWRFYYAKLKTKRNKVNDQLEKFLQGILQDLALPKGIFVASVFCFVFKVVIVAGHLLIHTHIHPHIPAHIPTYVLLVLH